MQQLLSQKIITHKDLESLLHSFLSSPAVVCSGLRCILRWCAVVCGVVCGDLWWSAVFRPTLLQTCLYMLVTKYNKEQTNITAKTDRRFKNRLPYIDN